MMTTSTNNRYKYPRTYHVPFSPGYTNDDKVLSSLDHFIGKEVVVTEKMDGECFLAQTKITMSDRTTLSIRDIVTKKQIGEHVLGVDNNGNIVPSKILNVFYNGTTQEWVRVKVKGPNGPYRTIICTPNHQFFDIQNNKYTEIKDFRPGELVGLLDCSIDLTSLQQQVLLGKMLGDGSISVQQTKGCADVQRAAIQFAHKIGHEAYVEWTKLLLGDLFSNTCMDHSSRYGNSVCIKAWTKFTTPIYNYFSNWIVNGCKIVPEGIIDDFSAIALAFWYMDDGSLNHTELQQDRSMFSVCGFDEKSCHILQQCLLKFGIESKIKEYSGYRYLILNYEATNTLATIISPYIPEQMEYKLPSTFRNGHKFEYVKENSSIHYRLRKVHIISIDSYLHSSNNGKYDIETETHNYFANGVLVHNCTTLYRDYMHARSLDSRHHPSRAWIKRFHNLFAYHLPPEWRICGENLYALHSIPYDNLESYFYVFSVWENEFCMDWELTKAVCAQYDLTHVPVLYTGIFDEQYLRDLGSNMDTTKMEGFVVRLAEGFTMNEFDNSVAKYVRAKHVTSEDHWMHQSITPNKLRSEEWYE